MLEQILLYAVGWVFHAILAGAVAVAFFYLGRGRAAVEPWEYTVFIVPFAVWLMLGLWSQPQPKNIENYLIEPCLLAVCLAVAVAFRVWLAVWTRQGRLAFYLYALVVLAAVLIWRYVPTLAL